MYSQEGLYDQNVSCCKCRERKLPLLKETLRVTYCQQHICLLLSVTLILCTKYENIKNKIERLDKYKTLSIPKYCFCVQRDLIKCKNKHNKSNNNSTDVDIKLTVFQCLYNLANTCWSIPKSSKC